MKNVFMMLGGVLVAVAGVLLWEAKREKPVTELAHKLEVAWADHHTIV